MKRAAAVAASCLLMTACATDPNYVPPAFDPNMFMMGYMLTQPIPAAPMQAPAAIAPVAPAPMVFPQAQVPQRHQPTVPFQSTMVPPSITCVRIDNILTCR